MSSWSRQFPDSVCEGFAGWNSGKCRVLASKRGRLIYIPETLTRKNLRLRFTGDHLLAHFNIGSLFRWIDFAERLVSFHSFFNFQTNTSLGFSASVVIRQIFCFLGLCLTLLSPTVWSTCQIHLVIYRRCSPHWQFEIALLLKSGPWLLFLR